MLCVCYHPQAWGAVYSGILQLMNTLTKVWVRWEQGVRLSGSAHYLNGSPHQGAAAQSGWDERLTWTTEWRRVTAGCPLRPRCWGSCGRCRRCCPRCAPGRPPWTPAPTWSALSPPLWSETHTRTHTEGLRIFRAHGTSACDQKRCVSVQLMSTD